MSGAVTRLELVGVGAKLWQLALFGAPQEDVALVDGIGRRRALGEVIDVAHSGRPRLFWESGESV